MRSFFKKKLGKKKYKRKANRNDRVLRIYSLMFAKLSKLRETIIVIFAQLICKEYHHADYG